jgi:hypothetical protein
MTMRALLGVLLVSALCLTGCAATKQVVNTPAAPAEVTVFQMSNFAAAKPYIDKEVQFTAYFEVNSGTPFATVYGKWSESHVLTSLTDENRAHSVQSVLVPATNAVLPTLKNGDQVRVKATVLELGDDDFFLDVEELTKL